MSGFIADYCGSMMAEAKEKDKTFLLYVYPEDKRRIGKLSLEDKLEWYAYQFQTDPRAAAINLSSKDFASFWKWRVLVPLKVKRSFFRVKNLEIFKKYQHISEMKIKRKEPKA